MVGKVADEDLEKRVPNAPAPGREQVASRAEALKAEQKDLDVEDPEAEARALLEDSEARTADPAARDPRHPGVVRRTSDDTTPPPKRSAEKE